MERAYLKVEAETHWPNPIISSASSTPTSVTGSSGVKMTGPYDYVAPSYWYVDRQNGGAYGFNTETSPGPAIPSLASRQKFLPDAEAAGRWLLLNIQPGDVVLIKGSRGVHLERAIEALTRLPEPN